MIDNGEGSDPVYAEGPVDGDGLRDVEGCETRCVNRAEKLASM